MYFDVNYYKKTYSDLQKAYGNNYKAYYEHFINWGINEGRASSIFLDVKYYKNKYSDLRKAYGNNHKLYYEHFINWGIKEGRQASASFDVKYYLNYNGDLKKAFGNNYKEAIKHYIYYGKNEKRKCVNSSNNGGNGNNTPNTEYTPTPDENGRKIIPQKELAKCITKVPITTENWQDYFELKDREDISKNAFGEILSISKHTTLNLTKDNTYYSTALEFEITNKNLMDDYHWNYNNGEHRKAIMSVNSYKNELNSFNFSYSSLFLIDKDPDTNVYDYKFTINDIKCNRTIGNVYIFNIPDSFWTGSGDYRNLYVECPESVSNVIIYNNFSWISGIGQDIENGTLKDINL